MKNKQLDIPKWPEPKDVCVICGVSKGHYVCSQSPLVKNLKNYQILLKAVKEAIRDWASGHVSDFSVMNYLKDVIEDLK